MEALREVYVESIGDLEWRSRRTFRPQGHQYKSHERERGVAQYLAIDPLARRYRRNSL